MNSLNAYFRQKFLAGRDPSFAVGLIEDIFKAKGYVFFEGGDFDLNIFGIRNSNGKVDMFDDIICVVFKVGYDWQIVTMDCTVDAGSYYMANPANEKGTGILVPGQYRGSHMIGKHHDYDALVQKGILRVYRDNNKDDKFDLDPKTIEEGDGFGINIHHAWDKGIAPTVYNWSAACTVIQDIKDFENFMELCKLSKEKWGNSFTYTLLESSDLG